MSKETKQITVQGVMEMRSDIHDAIINELIVERNETLIENCIDAIVKIYISRYDTFHDAELPSEEEIKIFAFNVTDSNNYLTVYKDRITDIISGANYVINYIKSKTK